MSILEGFKKFILRGNVVDLAVGVTIGAAFTTLVNAIVKDLLTPLIGAMFKAPDFSDLTFTINGSKFMYGDLINAIIAFFIVAIAVYFFVVTPINMLNERVKKPKNEEPNVKKCAECLGEVPVLAKRCRHCTMLVS